MGRQGLGADNPKHGTIHRTIVTSADAGSDPDKLIKTYKCIQTDADKHTSMDGMAHIACIAKHIA